MNLLYNFFRSIRNELNSELGKKSERQFSGEVIFKKKVQRSRYGGEWGNGGVQMCRKASEEGGK